LELDYTQVGIIVAIVGMGIASYIGFSRIRLLKEENKPKFRYERVKENKKWHIMITQPNKIINKFSISVDNKQLPTKNSIEPLYEITLGAGEGQNFSVHDGVQDYSKVVIKYDGHTKKMRYKDIPLSHWSM